MIFASLALKSSYSKKREEGLSTTSKQASTSIILRHKPQYRIVKQLFNCSTKAIGNSYEKLARLRVEWDHSLFLLEISRLTWDIGPTEWLRHTGVTLVLQRLAEFLNVWRRSLAESGRRPFWTKILDESDRCSTFWTELRRSVTKFSNEFFPQKPCYKISHLFTKRSTPTIQASFRILATLGTSKSFPWEANFSY